MKFKKPSQLILVSCIGLAVAALLTACQLVSIDYVFVAVASSAGSSTPGQIQTFMVDAASGALRTGIASVSSGGDKPMALTVTGNYANLYAANQGTANNVVHFTVADSGALTAKDTLTGLGTPMGIAVNQAGTYLYGVFSNGVGADTATVVAIPLGADGTMNTSGLTPVTLTIPGHTSDSVIPTAVTVLANGNAVYVTAYDLSVYNPGGSTTAGDTANPGWIYGFSVGSNGQLSPATGSPYQAGVKPTALAADPTNRFVYVTDFASSQLIGYTILSGSTLNFFIAPPTSTGRQPSSLIFDPRGKFLYITNELDSTVSAYAIDLSTGAPTSSINVANGFTDPTDTEPVAVIVEPALGRFAYTANYLGNSVSGFRLDPTGGALTPTQATPYPAGQNPSALASVPHGNHATQSVSP